MSSSELRTLLDGVASGRLAPADAERRVMDALKTPAFQDLGFARVDHHRAIRQGFPEVVLGLGKTPAQIAAIAAEIVDRGSTLLVTRATAEAYEAARQRVPAARKCSSDLVVLGLGKTPAQIAAIAAEIVDRGSTLLVTRATAEAYEAARQRVPAATYHADARVIVLRQGDVVPGNGKILVVAAGTSDLPVAEEAACTADLMGNEVERVYDVGVAGLHRLLAERARLESARVIIVVAGMEGALPSVVSGLVSVPVIAVPTSIGYGASFGGIAALLGMLNSCASGVVVVNIDNGFGAASVANLINHL